MNVVKLCSMGIPIVYYYSIGLQLYRPGVRTFAEDLKLQAPGKLCGKLF